MSRFEIQPGGQQIHISFGPPNDPSASRHPCFKLQSPEALAQLQRKIWEHAEQGGGGAPMKADKPGETNSGAFHGGCGFRRTG